MARDPLSAGARRFIAANILSVSQLELLLMLHDHPDEHWTADRAAQVLRSTPAAVALQLDALRSAGLLSVDGAADAAFRYTAGGEDHRCVRELADAYRRRKQTVLQAVLATMDSDVLALSDAFRLRRRTEGASRR